MKLTRALIGKRVEVLWRDPVSNPRRVPLRKAPKGRDALASWREYGVIDDITDGVARIVHSYADDPPVDSDPEPEVFCTWVPEDLIESVTVLDVGQPAKESA